MKNYKKYLIEVGVVAMFAIISLVYFWEPVMDGKVLSGHDHTGAVGAGVEMSEYRKTQNINSIPNGRLVKKGQRGR